MISNKLVTVLRKLDSAPKTISIIEQDYPGCIINDICELLKTFSESTEICQENEIVQCVIHALKNILAFSESEQCQVSSLLTPILTIAISPSNSSELTLVSATAWAKIICKLHADVIVARRTLLKEVECQSKDDFARITLIEGLLNCGCTDVIIELDFLLNVFSKIKQSCLTTSGHLFQSFQALKTWSHRLKELKPLKEKEEGQMQTTSNVMDSVNSIIFNNWENPVRGVPDILETTLVNVLEFHQKFDSEYYRRYLDILCEKVKNFSWKLKGKYRVLNVLLPRIGATEVLQKESHFGTNLFQCLSSNHLVSVGIAVYKTILKEICVDLWEAQFLQPLVECLQNEENELIQGNANIYLIPNSIKMLPKCANRLDKALETSKVTKQTWLAKLNILKTQRTLGHINELDNEKMEYIREGCCHTEPDVRISAMSVLCLVSKKGNPPTEEEMKLISNFIEKNLAVDNTSFRQVLRANFTQVMMRCRDFAVTNHRKLIKLQNSNDENVKCIDQIQDRENNLTNLMLSIDNIMKELFRNLYPGANYQRLICSLELLKVLDSCFFHFEPNKGVNKGSANSDPTDLVNYISLKHQLLNMYTTKGHCQILLSCVLHYMEDVRVNSFELLKNFNTEYAADESTILTKALELSCSPKYGECESSSVLFHLCTHWYSQPEKVWINQISELKLKNQYMLLGCAISTISKEAGDLNHHILPVVLLHIYKNLIEECSKNGGKHFLEYARSAPMHGMLTAISACLPIESQFTDCKNLDSFIVLLIDTISKSVNIMLAILSGGKDGSSEQAGSFEDMGIAIETIIQDTSSKLDSSVIEDDFTISDDHSLVLACIWLNIKAGSLMVARMVETYTLSYQAVLRCGEILTNILTKCRHKGAMENTMYALEVFCTVLRAEKDIEKQQIPSQILDQVLNELENSTDVSITRRSAGLPMLIQKIVSTEPRGVGGKTRTLLSKAIVKLIEIANKPVNVITEIYDMQQAHALHILRVLVHDSSLSFDIVQFCGDILVCCVEHFSSESWSIRFKYKNYVDDISTFI